MLPHPSSRLKATLAELQTRIAALPANAAAVIVLQECVPQGLDTIGSTAWVRAGFLRTDVNSRNWASRSYGTTTLVDRRLSVVGCFRIHYALTDMDRDALFVDVVFGLNSGDGKESVPEGYSAGSRGKTIRFCNTHLESLAHEPAFRPSQTALAAKFMHEDSVHGALLAGNLNAIQPFDCTLHSDNGLRDAYLELGGQGDSEEGYT
ncbi:hypothetical protein F5B22DRAFT_592663 [Xylaria bambusicola]|uniref:uncharacterized protein n=1 Tax=Xylaria bambusicola TaxID=326684 RepID=UPI00200786B2|nr:uncharacterized protein F5B22DRAFT_592663 [Xylaria bambusicola]KAI0522061.1 hypothetical protein F5B22DRAFT_592663 [Xylaria bambusicola]